MNLALVKDKNACDAAINEYIASVLTVNNIPLDNVFFVNTPAFIAFLSYCDKSIMNIINKPASELSKVITRKVIFEKCKEAKKFNCFQYKKHIPRDKIIYKTLSVMSYRLNWNESSYGEEYDLMKAFKEFINSRSHLPIFLYVDANFFTTIHETKVIRVAMLGLENMVV